MKKLIHLALFALTLPLGAQTYSVSWHTIDGGGGASAGGNYSVHGTIGQPDAGTMSGGAFTLAGGFWSLPGDPILRIQNNGGVVRVSWSKPAAGWVLEQATSLVSPPGAIVWSQVAPPYSSDATHYFITVPAPTGSRFYRLRHP